MPVISTLGRQQQEDQQFKVILGGIARFEDILSLGSLRPCFKTTAYFFFNVVSYYYKLLSWPGVVVHICNINILKAEAGGSQISGQPWLHCEILENPTKNKIYVLSVDERLEKHVT